MTEESFGRTNEEHHFHYLMDQIEKLQNRVKELELVIAQHNLCHDLHGKVGVREFADGCAAEQRKLYGCAPDADEIKNLQNQLEAERQTIKDLKEQMESERQDAKWEAMERDEKASLE